MSSRGKSGVGKIKKRLPFLGIFAIDGETVIIRPPVQTMSTKSGDPWSCFRAHGSLLPESKRGSRGEKTSRKEEEPWHFVLEFWKQSAARPKWKLGLGIKRQEVEEQVRRRSPISALGRSPPGALLLHRLAPPHSARSPALETGHTRVEGGGGRPEDSGQGGGN